MSTMAGWGSNPWGLMLQPSRTATEGNGDDDGDAIKPPPCWPSTPPIAARFNPDGPMSTLQVHPAGVAPPQCVSRVCVAQT